MSKDYVIKVSLIQKIVKQYQKIVKQKIVKK